MKAHLLLLGAVFVWGSTFVLVKDALSDITPLLFNFLRMALASLCLLLIYRRHIGHIGKRAVLFGTITGLALATGYQFQTAGLRLTTPTKSAFITGMTVIFVPLLVAIPRLRPRGTHVPRWNAFAGALLAFLGIVFITAPPHGEYGFHSINIGDVLTLFCAIAYAFHVVALAHFSPQMRFEQLALLQVSFATLFMAISLPVFEHPHVHWSLRVIAALAVAAVLATALAFSVQSWAQQIIPATHTALLLTMEPVFAWITSLIVLGEGLGLRSGIGAFLILAGITLTELLPARIQPTAHEGARISESGI
ncbi:MAG TPA: DMT family transporter [Acidobacteriaceae bacterium]|nr:DMT family transporter [Acidobacteriaceae bacterium]